MASATSPVFFAMITSTSIIRSTGEKKWMPMKRFGFAEAPASEVIGSVEVFEPNTASLPMTGFCPADRVFLDGAILEHRLDDEVEPGERSEIGGWRDAPERRRLVGLAEPAARNLLGEAVGNGRLAPVGARLVAVDEDDVDAGPGADIGDAGAHEAGADDADLSDRLRRHGLRDGGRACSAPASR